MESTELGERTIAGMQLSITGFQVFERVQRVDGVVRIPEDSEDTLLAIQFRAETIVDSPVPHPTDSELVAIADNQQFEPVDIEGEPSEPVSGKQYTGTDDARSGVVSEGWLFYEIPESTQQATISWSDSVYDAQTEWSLTFTAEDRAASTTLADRCRRSRWSRKGEPEPGVGNARPGECGARTHWQ